MKHILFLTSWYPGRVQPTNGDFVERHAKAVSTLVKVVVLFVDKDPRLPPGALETEKEVTGNLVVYKAYYGSRPGTGVIAKLSSLLQFKKVQRRLYAIALQEQGPPALVHVHVAMKAGLLARWLKKTQQIPYVVTEHWTGYYPNSTPNMYQGDLLSRRLNKKILQEATIFLPVSRHLGATVASHFVQVPFAVVPNVVDTTLFYYQPFSPPVFRFIHLSYLNYQKNPTGMIEAAAQLAAAGYRFELVLIGKEVAALQQLATRLGVLNTHVFIKAAIPHEEVGAAMQQSSALLLFSRFENLPCVLLEALCCGLPVVSSQVGGIAEVIDHSNGLLVESENTAALVKAMQQMMDEYNYYDRAAIATHAQQAFNYDTVARQYLACYEKAVQHPIL